MPFAVEPTSIPEVRIVRPRRFGDDRGWFAELLQADAFAELGLPTAFRQVNQSRSERGVVRGLHFQWDPPQGKLMRVVRGRAFLVAVDIRPGSPTLGRSVTVEGTAYRGRIELIPAPGGGVTAVNVVHLEDYLLGVVPLEIGPRTSAELAAIAAQAVAARTYAVAHLGGHAEIGFDLYGTVADQVYGGRDAERPEASDAVRSTAGRILTYGGVPIRAYYHSTCGGRTAAVDEVMDRVPAPYLRSVADRSPDGSDWCAISPRYRWTEEWSAERLNGPVRDELARMFGTESALIGPIEELVITGHTESGRVRSLAFRGPASELVLDRLDIRFALRDEEGRILGSTDFDLVPTGDGRTKISGRGYGHGAGMCQWGAIARARAGQSAEQILAVYYPGATLSRIY